MIIYGQFMHLLRFLYYANKEREYDANKIHNKYSNRVILGALRNGYIRYKVKKDKYQLTSKGRKAVIDFNKH